MPIDIAKLTGAETPEAREAEAGSFADAFVAAGVVRFLPIRARHPTLAH